MYRIPSHSTWPNDLVDKIVCGDATRALRELPDACVALIVTSPPYWNAVDYGVDGQIGQTSYDAYTAELLEVWREAERVLIPNGKLAIVTPILPIPKSEMASQHTRHLKNIAFDIESSILRSELALHRYGLFVWQKQTSKKMFGSYPYPPNIYEDNTIEFINVYVKDGVPPPLEKIAKQPSLLSQDEWRNLTMQVWPMYPEDVQRAGGHPAPFPTVLPLRLIRMFSFAACPERGFEGDIVVDMFNGSGATTLAAKASNRRWMGIDLNPEYCAHAIRRLHDVSSVSPHLIMLEEARVRGARDSRQGDIFAGVRGLRRVGEDEVSYEAAGGHSGDWLEEYE